MRPEDALAEISTIIDAYMAENKRDYTAGNAGNALSDILGTIGKVFED